MYNVTKLKILEIKRAMVVNHIKNIIDAFGHDAQEYAIPVRVVRAIMVGTKIEISPSETQMLIEELSEDLINLDYGIKTMLEGKTDVQEKAAEEDKPQVTVMDTLGI